jgi:hypothetical protein
MAKHGNGKGQLANLTTERNPMTQNLRHDVAVIEAKQDVEGLRDLIVGLIEMDIPAVAINLAQRKLSRARARLRSAIMHALDVASAARTSEEAEQYASDGYSRLAAVLWPGEAVAG